MRNVRFGVQRQLVSFACQHEDMDPDNEDEAGSLGELLVTLLKQLFPDFEFRTLQSDSRRNPGEFEAELQARAGQASCERPVLPETAR